MVWQQLWVEPVGGTPTTIQDSLAPGAFYRGGNRENNDTIERRYGTAERHRGRKGVRINHRGGGKYRLRDDAGCFDRLIAIGAAAIMAAAPSRRTISYCPEVLLRRQNLQVKAIQSSLAFSFPRETTIPISKSRVFRSWT